MTFESALPLIAYAFATSITPGPNNLMLMASGANFGLTRTLPHLAGVSLGFVIMAAAIGAGLIHVVETYPILLTALQVLCFAFVLYLAWKIATASPPRERTPDEGRPLSFIEAAAFQWVNPKALAMALTTVTAYTQEQTFLAVVAASALFGCINFPSCGVWILLGQQLRRWLQSGKALRIFNATMALLLLASMAPVVLAVGK